VSRSSPIPLNRSRVPKRDNGFPARPHRGAPAGGREAAAALCSSAAAAPRGGPGVGYFHQPNARASAPMLGGPRTGCCLAAGFPPPPPDRERLSLSR
jgi:hypothetical protein